MIGPAKEQDCLYYLELPSHNHERTSLDLIEELPDHKRILKVLCPTLLTRLSVDQFHRDICEDAKQKRTNFPISNSRSLAPFHLVHSDVWGPSTIPNISRAQYEK
jgi:hypothetical protein